MPEVLGDNVDRLVAVEIRPHGEIPRGIVAQLYVAARAHHNRPLTLLAAERLAENVKKGDVVLIGTGHGHDLYMPFGETDGPMGAAVLGRAVSRGLKAVPVFICKQQHIGPLAAACLAAGLNVTDVASARRRPHSCAILPMATEDAAGLAEAERLWGELEPRAVVSVEKLGPNERGIAHSAFGKALNDDAKFYHFVNLARERNVLSIGIGDVGNEIGFGNISATAKRVNTYGERCLCSCGGGITCAVETDVLVVAGTSNWGAYGVTACLAYLLKKPELLHDAETERRILADSVRAGGQDGLTMLPDLLVDGQPSAVGEAIVTVLAQLVEASLWEGVTRDF